MLISSPPIIPPQQEELDAATAALAAAPPADEVAALRASAAELQRRLQETLAAREARARGKRVGNTTPLLSGLFRAPPALSLLLLLRQAFLWLERVWRATERSHVQQRKTSHAT